MIVGIWVLAVIAVWVSVGAIIGTVLDIRLDKRRMILSMVEITWEASSNIYISALWPILLLFSPFIGLGFVVTLIVRKLVR